MAFLAKLPTPSHLRRRASALLFAPPAVALEAGCSVSLLPTTSPRIRRSLRLPCAPIVFLLGLWMLVGGAAAALVSTFDNCLPESIRNSPTHLQFHPILVAADFNRTDKELRVTVWGTVTGEPVSGIAPAKGKRDVITEETSWIQRWHKDQENDVDEFDFSLDDFPGPSRAMPKGGSASELQKRQDDNKPDINPATPTYFNSRYRSDYRFPTNEIFYNFSGFIVDQDTKATTLFTRGVIASFQAFKDEARFCRNPNATMRSVNTECPFGNPSSEDRKVPENRTESMLKRLGPEDMRNNVTFLTEDLLPSFTWTRKLPSDYQFASLGITFRIVSGDKAATKIGCVHVEVTPEIQDSYNELLTWLSAGILILVGVGTLLAAALNPWNGTTDVFRFSSNFGMDEDMLRLVTPGFADCIQWLQFVVLTGGLSLSYPGFYQPIVSNGAWSALLLNTSFYSPDTQRGSMWRADGVYAFEAWSYGYERLAQAVGLRTTNDILSSVLVYFAILLGGAIFIFQLWFWARWVFWKVTGVEEEDLTSRNWPFTLGILGRFTFTYFLLPVIAGCTFQFTVASSSAPVLTAIASVVLLAILLSGAFLSYRIWTRDPQSELFDDIPTLLIHGTFYNTYRENRIRYFVVPFSVNVLRGIAFGALQPSGIAQIAILAVCEIIMILSVYGINPYPRATSMNLWHFVFSTIRLITLLFMMAFIPSINATDAVKAWTGWVILGIHAVVLLFGFILKALQTMLELAVRGCSTDEEATRGGFAKVFGVRQLSRRKRHSKQTHRSSSLTATPISAAERKHTLTTIPSHHPHSRTNSSAILLGSPATEHTSMGITVPQTEASQSVHGHSNSGSTAAGYTPNTPGAGAGYGYIPPVDNAAGPYYRPPRTRRVDSEPIQYSPAGQSRASWASEMWGKQGRSSQGSLPVQVLAAQGENQPDADWDTGGRATPTTSGPGHRYTDSAVTVGSGRGGNTDYAVREVDFYYGVRGPALSTQPQRKLGTGPADPTGPVSTAKSWIRQRLGLARREKEKGFSVVRSSHYPDAILDAQRAVAEEEGGREILDGAGIGVAVTAEEEEPEIPHNDPDTPSESESEVSDVEPDVEAGPSSRMLEKQREEPIGTIELKPQVPRKSSKRKSRDTNIRQQLYDPPIPRGSTGRLPFEEDIVERRSEHTRSFSSTTSSMLEPPQHLLPDGRPASVGEVNYGRIGAVMRDERGDIRGSQAELVRGGSGSSKGSVMHNRKA